MFRTSTKGSAGARSAGDGSGSSVSVERDGANLLFSGFSLEGVLRAVAEQLGSDAQIVATERWIKGGIAGFFGRECFTVEAVDPSRRAPASLSSAEAAGPVDGVSFAKALAAALEDLDGATDTTAQPEPMPSDEVADTEAAPSEQPRGAPTQVEPPAAKRTPKRPARRHSTPAAPAGTTAIVGRFSDAMRTARTVALGQGIDPDEVLVMSDEPIVGHPAWLCIRDTADALRRRERWNNDGRSRLVVVPLDEDLLDNDRLNTTGAGRVAALSMVRTSLEALSPRRLRVTVSGSGDMELLGELVSAFGPVEMVHVVGEVTRSDLVALLDIDAPVNLDASTEVDDLQQSTVGIEAPTEPDVRLSGIPHSLLEEIILSAASESQMGQQAGCRSADDLEGIR